jgi:hypothetical protein
MTSPPTRRALKPGGPAARYELAALLGAIWVGEVVRPSRFLILAAPDLGDGPALDNRAGGFSGLEPNWGERVVRLSDVLLRVLTHGGEAWVVARRRPESPNLLLARLRERAAESGSAGRLRTAEVEALTAAGVYADGFTLAGPIAFTEAGPDFAGEGVVFDLDPASDRRESLRTVFEGLFT